MSVANLHERTFAVQPQAVGALLDALAAEGDPTWPGDIWPALRLDRPLGIGATGGHGPIRYHVVAYVPGQRVRFRFDRPHGFDGFHEFIVLPDHDGTVLQHKIAMRVRGPALLTWPLVFGPLHDALLEDLLDRAEEHLTDGVARRARWSWWIRVLRRLSMPRRKTSRAQAGEPA